MSNVLKFVVLERDKPLKLKEPDTPLKKASKRPLPISNTELSCHKFFEDESKQLLDEAVIKAREILEKTREEAEEIISKAEEKKEKIEQEAFEVGYESGYKEGFEAGKKEQEILWSKHLNELNKAVQELQKQNIVFKQHLERECLKLSLAIAEKILGRALHVDSEYFIGLIKNGLEKVGEAKEAIIRISESDHDRVAPLVSQLKSWKSSITLIKDPMLSPGDCIITGPNFEIDVGIHTQIENIAEALKELEVI